jgi:hypothetical protein
MAKSPNESAIPMLSIARFRLRIRSELHFPEVAAQTRIVSVARIRLDSRNLSDLSKG